MYVDDALIQKDTGANRFMYFAILNMQKYYPSTAYDSSSVKLNKDAQTNDTLGGTAGAGEWKDSAIADANFGIMLGKFVVNVYETVRINTTPEMVHYGELDMYGITSTLIFQAGWDSAALIAIVKLVRAKVASNALIAGGVTDAQVATVNYLNHLASDASVALTAA